MLGENAYIFQSYYTLLPLLHVLVGGVYTLSGSRVQVTVVIPGRSGGHSLRLRTL